MTLSIVGADTAKGEQSAHSLDWNGIDERKRTASQARGILIGNTLRVRRTGGVQEIGVPVEAIFEIVKSLA